MTTIEQVYQYLEQGKYIDCITAWNMFGTLSLKGIIHSLRKQGKDIKDIWCQNENTGTHYKKWFSADVRRVF